MPLINPGAGVVRIGTAYIGLEAAPISNLPSGVLGGLLFGHPPRKALTVKVIELGCHFPDNGLFPFESHPLQAEALADVLFPVTHGLPQSPG